MSRPDFYETPKNIKPMGCSQTLGGIPKDCTFSRGGVLGVWFANSDDVTGTELTDGKITKITMAETSGGEGAATSAKFKSYAFQKNSTSYTSTLNVDDSGNKSVSTELSVAFMKMDTAKRIEVDALAVADLVAIVKDANGKYWLVGSQDTPLTSSGGTGQTGASSTDANNYQLTFAADQNGFLYEIAEAALADILD